MGYCMNQQDTNFRIRKENHILALAAVQDLYYAKDKQSGGSSTGEKWFSWVNMTELKEANTLHDAIQSWRWAVQMDSETGDVDGIYFEGEKLGDEEVLFQTLAPFVEAGSFIEMRGEDGLIWRWKFDGKKMKEVTAKVVFEE